jgi:hypothetical protein
VNDVRGPAHSILVPLRPAAPIQAALVVVAAAGLIAFLVTHHARSGGTSSYAENTVTASAASPIPDGPVAVSPARLGQLAAAADQRLYWVGPRAGMTYELSRKGSELFLRYLPQGVAVGTSGYYLAVGTYPFADAFDVTQQAAARSGSVRVLVGGGGVAFYYRSQPESVFVSFPSYPAQLQVYAQDPAEARSLVTSGQLRPVPVPRGTP